MTNKIKIYAIVFSVILCISVNPAFSQLKVKGDNGKVLIGAEPSETPSIYEEDFDNKLSASIFGKGRSYRSGAKLSFGDFGRLDYYGWNVFIGEYGETDTDQLWLHGKNGIKLTYGRGEENYNLLSFDINGDRKMHFNTELFVQGIKIPANASSQQNSREIESPIERINELNGITYEYKYFNGESQSRTTTTTQNISSKEEADIMFFENLDEEMNNYTPTKIGFNAGQLAEHFPELVETDEDGNSYIDYTGLIPVLVEAIKEQSRVMTAQSMKIKEMELMAEASSINTLDSDSGSFSTKSMLDTNSVDRITTNAFLYQNTPNPFNTTTEIKYFLPEGATNSNIYVFNMQGNLLLTYNLTNNGFGTIEINGSSLSAGMYIYTLTINGKEVETKRMILTK